MAKKHTEALILAGRELSNCAYNLKQDNSLPERTRSSLAAAQLRWDGALDEYRAATKPAPSKRGKRD